MYTKGFLVEFLLYLRCVFIPIGVKEPAWTVRNKTQDWQTEQNTNDPSDNP